jgi:molecular chaperone GrpE
MIDAETKERLIEQFRASLDIGEDELPDAGEPLDLHTLLAEMAALKNEVRLQARQFKTALEQMQALSEALREHNERLSHDLERVRAQAADAKAQAERGLLLGLLELRDRLQLGLDAQMGWRPSPLHRLLGGERRFVQSLREGSTLTLQRLDELLAKYRVRAIAAVGQALDPQCMHAVAVEWAPEAAEGVVLRELRRGFYQGAELLRAAEVIVNKSSFNEKGTPE